jgi:hypothetical protein
MSRKNESQAINSIKKMNIPFTQVANKLLESKTISLKAKGLYSYMFSKPEGWVFTAIRMEKQLKESRDSILSGLKELKTSGWISYDKQGNGTGIYTLNITAKKGTQTRILPEREKALEGKSLNGKNPEREKPLKGKTMSINKTVSSSNTLRDNNTRGHHRAEIGNKTFFKNVDENVDEKEKQEKCSNRAREEEEEIVDDCCKISDKREERESLSTEQKENIDVASDAVAKIVRDWNIMAETCKLSKVTRITKQRAYEIDEKLTTNKNYKAEFKQVLDNISDSDFLQGHGSSSGWKINFSWIMVDTNFTKVAEGIYNERPALGVDIYSMPEGLSDSGSEKRLFATTGDGSDEVLAILDGNNI